MAAARLRRTSRHPLDGEDDDDDEAEHLDEEEQEKLIDTLQATNDAQNALYTKALVAISVLLVIPYLFVLPHDPLLATLSTTSLLSTAYILLRIPLTGISAFSALNTVLSPIERYLASLNGALSALVFLIGTVRKNRLQEWADARSWLGLVPGVLFALVMLARREMRAVDVRGLEALRYEYKGA
ncbi:MAG: hypothetical protein M1838_001989 [Thelocarpon superellum]|nr:MAG: hypothetical protein M1838_001989 [Thelocarpon superellum]